MSVSKIMPRKSIPGYRKHSAGKQAFVEWQGKRHYLGEYGTPESRAAYDKFIAQIMAEKAERSARAVNGGAAAPVAYKTKHVVIADFLKGYLDYAAGKYARSKPEFWSSRAIARIWVGRCGGRPTTEIMPQMLDALLADMSQENWSRNHFNHQLSRLKRMIRWGVRRGLVPPDAWHFVSTINSIRAGEAVEGRVLAESEEVRPVAWGDIRNLKRHVAPIVWSMINVQLLGGMRPGEMCQMRPCDIDMSDPRVWLYWPRQHKNKWRKKPRVIGLGWRAQAFLRPYLEGTAPDEYIFTPKKRMLEDRKRRRENATTKRRPGYQFSLPKLNPYYSTNNYRMTLVRAIEIARKSGSQISEQWHPNRLRHTRATQVAKRRGEKTAALVLGDNLTTATKHYIKEDMVKIHKEVARAMG